MSEHAVYSPSGAEKWATCAGSIAMEHGIPNDSNDYTDEGTAAHALSSMCLTEGKHPAAYLGRKLHVVNGVYDADYSGVPQGVGDAVRTFTVDTEMVAHVNTYVQKVLEYAKGNELQVEQRVPIDHVTGEQGAAGTSDAIVLTANGAELQVHDLKYGTGVKVFAKENKQGILYLLGALEQLRETLVLTGEPPPSRFRFVIHQPRLDWLDEWGCTYDELMEHAETLKQAAGLARIAFEFRENWMGKTTNYLRPGEHCKPAFCRARATCPALAQKVQDDVGADFDVLVAGTPAALASRVPAADQLALLGQKFAALDLIQDWCKQVRARCEAVLFESHNAPEVQTALGIKLVAGKKGNRQWTDENEAAETLKKMRLKIEDIYDMSVKSPTVITKALKDTPKRLAKVTPLITQKEGQPTVTDLADKRPALVMSPVSDDFSKELTDEELA